jgi:hypothetical protein
VREPVAISVALGTVIASAIALGALFWPDRLTPEISAAIIVLANSIIALGVALFARSQSTPTASPRLETGTPLIVTKDGEAVKAVRVS